MQRIQAIQAHLQARPSAATEAIEIPGRNDKREAYGVDARQLTAAIVKGMQFLADNTTTEGQYTLGVDETHNNYKEIPLGYQAAGMQTEAIKCLEFAWQTFIKPQGPEGAVPPTRASIRRTCPSCRAMSSTTRRGSRSDCHVSCQPSTPPPSGSP